MIARKLVFSFVLLLGGMCCLWRAVNPSSVDASASLHARNVGYSGATSPTYQSIETVQVAQRVVGRNPIREAVEPWEPDPQTWREIRLHMRKPSGRSLWITLLRPFIWLQTNDAAVGDTIDMDLHELGASGPAEVTYIGPCPEIPPGDDPVVIGTFKHEVDENSHVINLWLEGDAEPTGVTDNHPYWSVDRAQFVPAGELRVGETVDTLAGTARVARLESRAYTGFLYNLETTEHVYRVGSLGTLVHNSCAREIALGLDVPGGGYKELAQLTGASHWRNWKIDGITRRTVDNRFGRAFHQAAQRADKIHFSLDGIDDVQAAVRAGKRGFVPGNVTNAELEYIFSNPDLRKKTIFYRNGLVVPSPL